MKIIIQTKTMRIKRGKDPMQNTQYINMVRQLNCLRERTLDMLEVFKFKGLRILTTCLPIH